MYFYFHNPHGFATPFIIASAASMLYNQSFTLLTNCQFNKASHIPYSLIPYSRTPASHYSQENHWSLLSFTLSPLLPPLTSHTVFNSIASFMNHTFFFWKRLQNPLTLLLFLHFFSSKIMPFLAFPCSCNIPLESNKT